MKRDLEMNDHGADQGHNPVQEAPGPDHVQQLQDLGHVLDPNQARDHGPDPGLERHHLHGGLVQDQRLLVVDVLVPPPHSRVRIQDPDQALQHRAGHVQALLLLQETNPQALREGLPLVLGGLDQGHPRNQDLSKEEAELLLISINFQI